MRDWLREARAKNELSENDVALRVGITQAAYHYIETGERNPKPETAKKIGAVLGFSWTRFFEDDEESEGDANG